jgi:hypothetical protein
MKKIVALLPILLLLSCSVQKRKYQNGFYVSWKHNNKEVIAAKSDKASNSDIKTTKVFASELAKTETIQGPEASVENVATSILPKQSIDLKFDYECDELIFRDGSEMSVHVVGRTQTEILYKKCGQKEGPTLTCKKSDLFLVKYVNGTKETFENAPKNGVTKNTQSSRSNSAATVVHPKATTSLVLGILSFFLSIFGIPLAIVAIITGNSAIREINANPDKFSGKGIANVGRTLGIVFLSILAFLLFILFVLLM